MPYILEVQKMEWNNKTRHIGYMNIVFETKQLACDYYIRLNPHMPLLSEKRNYCSDWDPNTYLMYIVREHFYEYLQIPSFENSKNSKNSNSNSGSLNY